MFFQQFKAFLTINKLIKNFIFFNNINHETYNIEKSSNETAIEICKPYKCLDVFNVNQGFPILNGFDFFEVYADAFSEDNLF